MLDLRKMLTQNELREKFTYDPLTGIFSWVGKRGRVHRSNNAHHYIVIKGLKYQTSHLAWFYMTDEWPPAYVDHINGDSADNRFSNLRLASAAQNARNRKKHVNNSSGFKGVYWNKFKNRWMARIRFEGKLKHIGCYDTPEQAAEAYERTAQKLFGEFHRPDPNITVRSRPTLNELGL